MEARKKQEKKKGTEELTSAHVVQAVLSVLGTSPTGQASQVVAPALAWNLATSQSTHAADLL